MSEQQIASSVMVWQQGVYQHSSGNSERVAILGDPQDRGAIEAALPEEMEGAVRFVKREGVGLCSNGDVGRELQEIDDVLSGAIRHAADRPLLVKQRIGELRDRSHRDPGNRHSPPLPKHSKRLQDQPTDRREDDRAVETARRVIFCLANPTGAQLPRESAVFLAPGKDEDLASPVDRDLDGDVG